MHLSLQNCLGHYRMTFPALIAVAQGQYLTTSSSPLLLWVAEVIVAEELYGHFSYMTTHLLVIWKRKKLVVIPEILARVCLSADRESPGGWVGSVHSLPRAN